MVNCILPPVCNQQGCHHAFSTSTLAIEVAIIAISICAVFLSFAADAVTDAMQAAYGPYRVALFKTNSNSQAEAQQAMTQAQQSWGKLAAQFGSKPPAPYDRDTAFGASVADVSKVYTKATEQVTANQLTAAHETLEAARDIMAQLRRRNQVVVYSDHMNAYHSEMEHVLIDGGKNASIAQRYAATHCTSWRTGLLKQEIKHRSAW